MVVIDSPVHLAGSDVFMPMSEDQALVSRRTGAERQGEVLGVNQSAASMARILGPIFGVTLYKASAAHLLPYICGAALLLVMLPLVPLISRGGKEGT